MKKQTDSLKQPRLIKPFSSLQEMHCLGFYSAWGLICVRDHHISVTDSVFHYKDLKANAWSSLIPSKTIGASSPVFGPLISSSSPPMTMLHWQRAFIAGVAKTWTQALLQARHVCPLLLNLWDFPMWRMFSPHHQVNTLSLCIRVPFSVLKFTLLMIEDKGFLVQSFSVFRFLEIFGLKISLTPKSLSSNCWY